MTMRRTTVGQFELPIAAIEAIEFFTPEGERAWVPGWDPTYPEGAPAETSGTVFVTAHGDVETIWVIEKIDRAAHISAYCRITPEHQAGTVRVRCVDLPQGGCVVSVEYDMTALRSDRSHVLDTYDEASFEAMMNEWATTVIAAL
jgi:hypothetical protein